MTKIKNKHRIRKGKFAGLPATFWAELFNCSVTTVKKILRNQEKKKGGLEWRDIGQLIQDFRNTFGEDKLEKFLNRWTGPQSHGGIDPHVQELRGRETI